MKSTCSVAAFACVVNFTVQFGEGVKDIYPDASQLWPVRPMHISTI